MSPMPSVVALICRDSMLEANELVTRYLLIKRQTEPLAGKWALVGGGWEFGEVLDAAITREVKEETGLDTTFVALRGLVHERIAPFGSNDDGGHFLLFVCDVSAPTGEAIEQSEGEVAWFSMTELKELRSAQEIVPTDYAILRHFSKEASTLPYVEAEVLASTGETSRSELVRFELVPNSDSDVLG